MLGILKWIKNIICINEISAQAQELQAQVNEMKDYANTLEARVDKIETQAIEFDARIDKSFESGFNNFLADDEQIEKMNLILSVRPVIWGDKARLHISKYASVSSCMFNLNSGDIVIDDYVFAGSSVSILTGAHDYNLNGLARRETEIHKGNDIIIQKGVWLGSNCTILGPCEIGENAVIAAGAVVAPKTKVEPNAVYAGIPAKKIKDIKSSDNAFALIRALERENGVVYGDGWSEKTDCLKGDKKELGHWLSEQARLYTTHDTIVFECNSYNEEILKNIEVSSETDDVCVDYSNGKISVSGLTEGKINTVEFINRNREDIFFFL